MKKISVLIPTYNRAKFLPKVLESLARQSLPGDEYEIIVVDNASTDRTRDIVKNFTADSVTLHYIFEPRQGVSFARNTGIRQATARYVALLDDDAYADPTWLEDLLDTFYGVTPTPHAVAGSVVLDWEGRRPNWFPFRYESLIGAFDLGVKEGFLGPDQYFLTMNVAFDRETLLNLGGFNPKLGPKGNKHIVGDDIEIYQRLVSGGYMVYYEPKARVNHMVPKSRRTRKYLRSRLFWQGATQPVFDMMKAERLGVPFPIVRRTLYDGKLGANFGLDILRRFSLGDTAGALESFFSLVWQLGRTYTNLRLLAENRKAKVIVG